MAKVYCDSKINLCGHGEPKVCVLDVFPAHIRHVTSEGEWWEKGEDGKINMGSTELVKVKVSYPHTDFIANLLEQADYRKLTKTEVLAITEAQMFESLIEEAVPSLRAALDSTEQGSRESHNAALFLAVACDFAQGMANDVQGIMTKAQRIVAPPTEH